MGAKKEKAVSTCCDVQRDFETSFRINLLQLVQEFNSLLPCYEKIFVGEMRMVRFQLSKSLINLRSIRRALY